MMQQTIHRAMIVLALAALPVGLTAQDNATEKQDAPVAERHASAQWNPRVTDCRKQTTRSEMSDCNFALSQTYTYYLQNVSQQNDANEIVTSIRNMFDPSLRVYLDVNQNAITFSTWPEEYARIETFIKTLDRPHKTFRLTYTITDFDGDKRVGTQHFNMVAVEGQRATLKQGNKIPVATGSYDDPKASSNAIQTQFTYLDVGINIDATPTAYANGIHLASKVEQSSVAPEPSVIAGVSEPIIRQSVLQSVIDVPSGKPVIIGSVDISGTTHHLDVAVAIDPIP